MWRRPRLVTADTKSPATAAWQTCQGGVEPSRRTRQRDGGGTWADNATAERREAGLPVAREGPCLASVASRVTRATNSRLDASRRSANPLARGSAATKVKEGRRRTRRQKCAGKEETGLFEMVNRKRCGAMHRQGAGAPSRQRQRARVPAERAPRRAFLHEVPVRAREPGPRGHTMCCVRYASGPGSRCARPGHESGRTTGVLFASRDGVP
jgi:hypothetical protein